MGASTFLTLALMQRLGYADNPAVVQLHRQLSEVVGQEHVDRIMTAFQVFHDEVVVQATASQIVEEAFGLDSPDVPKIGGLNETGFKPPSGNVGIAGRGEPVTVGQTDLSGFDGMRPHPVALTGFAQDDIAVERAL